MAQKSNPAAGLPANHVIKIMPVPPVAFAVPGIRKAKLGDKITFENKTGKPVQISTADEVLKEIPPLDSVEIVDEKTFTVIAEQGTHELSIHYCYEDWTKGNRLRAGFAIGASSPKIVIVRPPE